MRGKSAAIEMSIGTIVIVVLSMSMLIMGMILIKNIFSGTSGAVDSINKGVINEINELFTDKNSKLAVAPSTRKIEIEQGTLNQGFAFSVRNVNNEEKRFSYGVSVDPDFSIQSKCGISTREADDWVLVPSGSVNLGHGAKSELPELVTISVPVGAPLCTIPFVVSIKDGATTYVETKVELTILAE
jgi:hypothetical protein